MQTATAARVTIRDQAGRLNVTLDLDLDSHTPQQLIDHLLAEGHIMRAAPNGEPLSYKLAKDGNVLVPDQPLATQGVKPGDAVELLTVNVKG